MYETFECIQNIASVKLLNFIRYRKQAWDQDGAKIDNVAQRLNYRVQRVGYFRQNKYTCATYES